MFSKPLTERIADPDFRDFIEYFLQWTPEERCTPVEALNHPWVTKGLPSELKQRFTEQHRPQRKEKSLKRIKTKSKERASSAIRLNAKASQ